MVVQKKTDFENYKIHKVISGDLLSDKPIFSKDAQYLIVSNNEACHLYNTTTGEHLGLVLTCDSPIISVQLDPADENFFLATTKDGKIYKREFLPDGDATLLCELNMDKEALKKLNFIRFFAKKKKEGVGDKATVTFFHSVVRSGTIYASWSKSYEKNAHAAAFDLSGNLLSENNFINVRISQAPENFTVGNDFIALLADKYIHVAQLSSKRHKKHEIDVKKYKLKIVAHPNDVSFATGDKSGRITLWKNIFNVNPLKDVYHWHTLPVQTLIFTESGSHMFSGGQENVLVKWTFATRTKTFLPRLSSNILHISISRNNTLLSVSTADSRILIVNLNLNCLATIQNFSRRNTFEQSYGAILTQDPRSEALVISGRTGHVQFLSSGPDVGRFLYTFDVTQSNFITKERNMEAQNIEVRFTKFTRCGKWLITAEAGGDEARLKFWWFDAEKQEFSLNTDVDAPHGSCGLEFMEVSSGETVATGGSDGTFRLWGVMETMHLQETRLIWCQLGAGSHHQQPFCADFSRDSSLLAVGFGPALTLWGTQTCEFKCTLVPPLEREKLKFVCFGNHNVSHLVVAATENEVNCWNIVTLCRQWVVLVNLSLLVSDPNSSFMCAFSNKKLFMFNPSSPQPELQLNDICEKGVIAAHFIAQKEAPYLYFLTEDQTLYCLADEIQKEAKVQSYLKTTPFAQQLAQNIRKDVIPGKSLEHILLTDKFVENIFDSPAHAMPPVSLLVEDYITSMLQRVQLSAPSLKEQEEESIVVESDSFKQRKSLTEYDLEKAKNVFLKIFDKNV